VTVAQVSEPQPQGKPIGPAQMFALVMGGACIMLIGAVMGQRFFAPQPTVVQQPAANAPAAPADQPAQRAEAPQEDDGSGNVVQLDMQDINGAATTGTRRPTGGSTAAPKPATSGKQLTEEQKAMLARMGGGLDSQGPNLRAPSEAPKASSGGGGGDLTAEQLSAVVMRGRKNLQRCYETALRGANSDETVRMDVDITVSPSGNVTSVRTTGRGLPGMEECITRTVKMWRFPTSSDGTQTRFPVVFQPGA
jgi:hypothetical protein